MAALCWLEMLLVSLGRRSMANSRFLRLCVRAANPACAVVAIVLAIGSDAAQVMSSSMVTGRSNVHCSRTSDTFCNGAARVGDSGVKVLGGLVESCCGNEDGFELTAPLMIAD